MKFKQVIYILCISCSLLVDFKFLNAASLVNGNDLALSIRNTIPSENNSIAASMEVTLKNRKRINTSLTIETKLLSQDEFLTTYKSPPPNNTTWKIKRKIREKNKYQIQPEENNPEKNIYTGLANSSFTLADLGLEFLHWPIQKTIRKQRRKSRLCNVLESKPIKKANEEYSRVLSWIDEKSGAIIAADFFDLDNNLLKRFSVKGLTKIKGLWQVDELEMRDYKNGTKSRLKLRY